MADDWGCQVALCMANPAGPTALAECVAPMQRLYDALRNKRGWPSCGRVSAPSAPVPQFTSPSQYANPDASEALLNSQTPTNGVAK